GVSHALNTATIILIAVMAIRVSDILITNWGGKWAKKTKSTIDDALLPIFHRASKVSLSILALFFVMSEWSIDLTGVLAGLGIAGLALGFAVKDSLSNIFGGISLILDKAIQVGDYIELGDISGEVVDVGLRSTRVRTWDNDMLIIPNGNLANSQFKNYKLPDLKSRFTVNFGVEYGTNPDKVKDLVIALIKKNKKIIKDPAPFVRFQDMGDSALNFTAYCWVENLSDKWSTREKLTTDIYNELNKKKIGIPFPTRTIYTKKG
ncbi:MAG: mechanosensitive ion channel family protein, partial [Candidatus Nanoarchaeia archaeon]